MNICPACEEGAHDAPLNLSLMFRCDCPCHAGVDGSGSSSRASVRFDSDTETAGSNPARQLHNSGAARTIDFAGVVSVAVNPPYQRLPFSGAGSTPARQHQTLRAARSPSSTVSISIARTCRQSSSDSGDGGVRAVFGTFEGLPYNIAVRRMFTCLRCTS